MGHMKIPGGLRWMLDLLALANHARPARAPVLRGRAERDSDFVREREPIAAKRGRSRLAIAPSHCSRVNDAAWEANGSLEGFMPSIAAAYAEGVRCQASPEATAKLLGLDRRSSPGAYPVGLALTVDPSY